MHVQEQFLEVQEIPGRLRGIRCAVGVGVRLERRLQNDRNDDQAQQQQHSSHELDRDQVRPYVYESFGLLGGGRRRFAAGHGSHLLASGGGGSSHLGGHTGACRSLGDGGGGRCWGGCRRCCGRGGRRC